MVNNQFNLIKIIKIFSVIFGITFFRYLAYDMFLGDVSTEISIIIFLSFFI